MATHDTDPQREQPFHDDTSRTEPDAPPLDDAASNAASLLAGLAESSQPTPNVAETEGHVAAAYAAAPRRPPRPNDKTIENPAVFINATVPLPAPPPSSGHQKLGPAAPPVVSMKGDPTVLGGARLFEALQNQTDPGERARNQLRIYFAAIAGVVVAALIAITALAIQRAPAKTAPASSSSPPPSSSSPPSSAVVAATSPSLTPSVVVVAQPPVTAAPSSTPSSASPTPTVTTTKPAHGRAHGSGSFPSPRPSATFAEPDRHL
jgi:eukaryotic-like serine/threonine-protein kinase